MATSVTYPADGTVGTFAVPFPYLAREHVKVEIGGVQLAASDYTWTTAAAVSIDPPPEEGVAVRVFRKTTTIPLTEYQRGAVLTKEDLEVDQRQALYLIEELEDIRGGNAETVQIADVNGHFTGATVEEALRELALRPVGGGDDALRADLVAEEETKGAALVTFKSAQLDAIARPLSEKLDENPSIVDFGGVGDNVADNAAAFAKAQASAAKRILLPEGTYYTTTPASQLTKHYYGTGTIRTSGGDYLPGRFTAITAPPAKGTGSDVVYDFSGDLSKVEPMYHLLGINAGRKALDAKYFEATVTPRFQRFDVRDGWSGWTAALANPVAAGATTATLDLTGVGATSGFTVGDTIGFTDGVDTDFVHTATVSSISGSTLGFTPGAPAGGLTAGTIVTHGKRTAAMANFVQVVHRAGGDAGCLWMRGTASYAGSLGQRHPFYRSTMGLMHGEVAAEQTGVYINTLESNHIDNGHDVVGTGTIMNFQRTNDTGVMGAYWIGHLVKSEGTKPINSAFVALGKMNVGLDLVKGDFGTNKCAIGLKANDRIYFDNDATNMGDYSLVGNVIGNTYIEYDAAESRMEATVDGTLSFSWAGDRLATAGRVDVGTHLTMPSLGKVFLNGLLGNSHIFHDSANDTVKFFARGSEHMRMGSELTFYTQVNLRAVTPANGAFNLTNTTPTTIAPAAGAAGALPATPRGYMPFMIDGTVRHFAYY